MKNRKHLKGKAGKFCSLRTLFYISIFHTLCSCSQSENSTTKTEISRNHINGEVTTQQSAPSKEHLALNRIIGRWITEGETMAQVGSKPDKITTSDVFDWAPGGYFVIHNAYGKAGNEKGGAIEIIGYDPETKKYKSYCFDSYGMASQEEIIVTDSVWCFKGKSAQCTMRFNQENTVCKAYHERSMDNGITWQHIMDVVLTKIK